MEEFTRFDFQGADCRLSAVDFGGAEKPDLVLVHGMRDHGLSMSGIASALKAQFHVIAVDIRGHGHSDNPGVYSMAHFVADLRALVLDQNLKNISLIGHSLGGHIVSRYGSTFSHEVASLVLLDGMGPPGPKMAPGPSDIAERYKFEIEGLLNQTTSRRQIANKQEALKRLRKNNPRLAPDLAELIVEYGVEDHPEGGVRWRWDPRVNMIWQTFSQPEAESLLGRIVCPVLLVTGDEGLGYWTAMRSELNDPDWYEAELERRAGLFKNAERHVIPNAGHMLHYDQPEALNRLLVDFLASDREPV